MCSACGLTVEARSFLSSAAPCTSVVDREDVLSAHARTGSNGRATARKYRQAAFVYLHVGLLYEAAVWSAHSAGVLPPGRGPVWLWLVLGAGILAFVFWGLWSWQNRWFARIVWGLHALRLPALLEGAFLGSPGQEIPSDFYLTALVVVLVNLGFLARAGWDL